jgi:predicted CXXCH cytochrome family protein
MFLERLLLAILLAGGGWILFAQPVGRLFRGFVLLLVLCGFVAAWCWQRHLAATIESQASLNVPGLRRDEYASSDSCRACHPDQYASWQHSFHRTMTQLATPQSVRGNFENVSLQLNGETYRLERRGNEFWADLPNPDGPGGGPAASGHAPRVQRRVTMVTGSHHMQAYWVENGHGNQQMNLPFTYLLELNRWAPRRNVFLLDPKQTNLIQVWNVGCIDCHSTAGQPGSGPGQIDFASRAAELGIACEACHGPAAAHIRLNEDPLRRYRMHGNPADESSIVNPARLSTKRASEICGRCHSVHVPKDEDLWLKAGEHYQPGEDLEAALQVLRRPRSNANRLSLFWGDGMIRVSGREYNGLIKTACYVKGDLSCLSCHSMHRSSPTNQLATAMESNAACLPCHTRFGQQLEKHTHHSAGSSGSLCYNCHMPYTSFGLLKGIRSHQISSPTVEASLEAGRPNACNLCHLDKTLAWTAQNLAAWYQIPEQSLTPEQKTVAASILWALQGDAGQRALIAWHMGWQPARDVSKTDWLPPYLAALMQDPYSAVRFVAGRSLKRISDYANLDFDFTADGETLHRSAERVLETWRKKSHPGDNPSLLLVKDGQLSEPVFSKLLESRNNRVVELNE